MQVRTALPILVLYAASMHAQTGSPPFVNPGEIASHDGKLQAVIVVSDTDRVVPNVGKVHLRFFQGWDAKGWDGTQPAVKVPANPAAFSPGPTLRAKAGDKVEIMFLNTTDDANFPNTVAAGKCDQAFGTKKDANGNLVNVPIYPLADQYPNCFHASSTANLHFHGTHTTPDALGDNVLIEVMPVKDTTPQKWNAVFKKIFAMPTIPTKWQELPGEYRDEQERLLKAKGQQYWDTNAKQIALGQFPQYIAGAFPNAFILPNCATQDGCQYKALQSPGTHWYHAHKHGSTALHSLNGLAGAFIIEGTYDDFLKTFYHFGATYGPDFEKVFVFQEINPEQNLHRNIINFGAGKAGSATGPGPGQVLVNGLVAPTLTMRPGAVQLWRIVNATPGSAFNGGGGGIISPSFFQTAGFTFEQTAKDGVQFSQKNFSDQPFISNQFPNGYNQPAGLMVAGGNRVDVLVKAPAAKGTYAFASQGATVLWVKVDGDPNDMPLPDRTKASDWPAIPWYLTNLQQPPTADRPLPLSGPYPHYVSFSWDAESNRAVAAAPAAPAGKGTAGFPPKWTIDNRQFAEFGPLIDQCMPLNGLQDWVLENHTTVMHSFHIHINPFQVVSVETPVQTTDAQGVPTVTYKTYTPAGDPIWQDVVSLPAGLAMPLTGSPTLTQGFAPGRVTIRHQFVDFTGTFVLHCHILGHEDRGMMQLVRIVPLDRFPTDCQAAIPHHH